MLRGEGQDRVHPKPYKEHLSYSLHSFRGNIGECARVLRGIPGSRSMVFYVGKLRQGSKYWRGILPHANIEPHRVFLQGLKPWGGLLFVVGSIVNPQVRNPTGMLFFCKVPH